MEAKRRQKRSWIENRIHDASGDFRPGALEAFLGSLGGQFLINHRKNDIPKTTQKSMPKKHRKMIPKGIQNDAKWIPKLMIFHFGEKFVIC